MYAIIEEKNSKNYYRKIQDPKTAQKVRKQLERCCAAATKANGKPVKVWGPGKKFLGEFESVRDATRKLQTLGYEGITNSIIKGVASGHKTSKFDITAEYMNPEDNTDPATPRGYKTDAVKSFVDKDRTIFVKEYKSITEAMVDCGTSRSSGLGLSIRLNQRFSGLYWSFCDPEKQNEAEKGWHVDRKKYTLKVTNCDDGSEMIFEGLKRCANYFGVSEADVKRASSENISIKGFNIHCENSFRSKPSSRKRVASFRNLGEDPVQIFKSISDADESLHHPGGLVSTAIRTRRCAGGFYWDFVDSKDKEGCKYREPTNYEKPKKRICVMNLKQEVVSYVTGFGGAELFLKNNGVSSTRGQLQYAILHRVNLGNFFLDFADEKDKAKAKYVKNVFSEKFDHAIIGEDEEGNEVYRFSSINKACVFFKITNGSCLSLGLQKGTKYRGVFWKKVKPR